MGERKVLNKYYPPDFDPAKLPRGKKTKQIPVRHMLSMTIRCNTCGNFMYKGTKLNSRKEVVEGETYLGIQIFRFYGKCTCCSAEYTMKTDPRNSDYVVEFGATRNFEPWRAEDKESDERKKKREAEEIGDAMKSLENKTLDSKREMDILAALDEMKSMKSRHATVSVDKMLAALQRKAADKEKRLVEEDEALIKSIFSNNSEVSISRIRDRHGETSNNNLKRRKISKDLSEKAAGTLTKAGLDDSDKQGKLIGGRQKPNPLAMISVVKKPETSNVKRSTNTNGALLSLCLSYGSSDED
ncbi:putative CWC16 protein [Medicago truncatula]|uniref:Splicing factor YJU2 n=1 Tax=Medicago truncatula TaxID=3880 RepID=A0A072VLH0_MEDTR|nr:splicing factor YJU2 [Medicago truncatula]XP_039684353.1 splicing factor YJU2 [Medicago truncatula]KEH42687.1 coiled-coil protein [Medicago truncatula]RHN80265.1 putative CWC16 protein [Medicago truncatula]